MTAFDITIGAPPAAPYGEWTDREGRVVPLTPELFGRAAVAEDSDPSRAVRAGMAGHPILSALLGAPEGEAFFDAAVAAASEVRP